MGLESRLTFKRPRKPTYCAAGPLRIYCKDLCNRYIYYTDADADATFEQFGCSLFWVGRRVPCVGFGRPGASVVLVFAHANHEDLWRSHRVLEALGERCGAHVVGFEYPGYGPAPGKPSEASTVEALRAVLRYLTDRCGFGLGQVVLVGRSIGTGVCLQVAAGLEGLGGVVLVSPFSSIRHVVQHGMGSALMKPLGWIVSPFATHFNSMAAVAELEAPLLLLHGEDDEIIPKAHSKQLLYAAHRSPHPRLLEFEGMDHNNVWEQPELLDAIAEFVVDRVSPGEPKLLAPRVSRWTLFSLPQDGSSNRTTRKQVDERAPQWMDDDCERVKEGMRLRESAPMDGRRQTVWISNEERNAIGPQTSALSISKAASF